MYSWKDIEYFEPKDFTCPCGCGWQEIRLEFVHLLDLVRKELNNPIMISSGCRCPKWNKKVGGAVNSFHTKTKDRLYACAADVYSKTVLRDLYVACESIMEKYKLIKFQGLGSYPQNNFIHVDMGDRFSRWVKKDGTYIYLF